MSNDSKTNDILEKILNETSGIKNNSELSKYTCDQIINESTNKKSSDLLYSSKYKSTDKSTSSLDQFNINSILSQYASSKQEDPTTEPEKKLNPSQTQEQDSIIDRQSTSNQPSSSLPPTTTDKEEEVSQKKQMTEEIKPIKKEKPKEIVKKQIILTFNNHLDFVNYVELEHAQNIGKNEHNFVLQGLKQSNTKYNVLQSSQLTELSSLIFKQEVLLNALGVKGDFFIVGTNTGIITIYSIVRNSIITTLFDKNIKPSSVNCFDISDDGNDLLVGYANGTITLWDLNTFKCKKIMDKVHENCCLAIKILVNDSKAIEFYSSDVDGRVYKTICKSMYIIYTVSSTLVIETKNNPIYLLKLMTISNQMKMAMPELSLIPTTLIIGNLTSVKLMTVDTETKEVFKFICPSLEDYFVFDAGYGIGRLPQCSSFNEEREESNDNNDNHSEFLLAMAWSKYIYLYRIALKPGGKFGTFAAVGYYINSANVLRIGFIANSILYFFDASKFIKVINTKDLFKGELLNLKEEAKKSSEESRLVDLEVKFQLLFQDLNKNAKALYTNLIIEYNNTVYLFGRKTAYEIKLLNWEKCLNNYLENKDWGNLLLMGMDIFNAKITALADIPQDESIRRSTTGKILRGLINQYVLYSLGGGGGDYSEKEKIVSDCIDIAIEFCIEIDSVDYLLDNLQKVFDSYNYGQLFLSRLEPFILSGKLTKVNLSEEHIEGILTIYKEKNQLDLLEQLLIHLNINSIDNEKVKDKCTQWGLINPLIYISMNGKNEDYFNPITKIYEIYKKASNKTKFTSLVYNEDLYGKKLEHLKSSKQYIGCKLLWYINWCLKGIKFPNGYPMELNSFRNLVLNTMYWMLNATVFDELLTCNASIFMYILKRMFSGEKTLGFLVEGFSDSNRKMDTIAKLHTDSMQLLDLNPANLISLIVYLTKQKLLPQNLQMLYEFVIRAAMYTTIDKELIIEAIGFLLCTEEVKAKSKDELNEIALNIIQLLEKYSNELEEIDYKLLQDKSNNNYYDLVIIYLFQREKNWKKSLDIYLAEDCRIKERSLKVFQWLNQQLTLLKEANDTSLKILKEQIINHIIELGKQSSDKMVTLINTWLKDQSKIVLSKLADDPSLKLKYVETLLKQYLLRDADNYDINESEQYESLLLLHIELLCILGKKDEVLKALKNNVYYPSEDCLQLCLEYNIDDATIYLYQQTGAPALALNLCIVRLETVYKQIIDTITKNVLDDNTYTILFQSFSSILDDGTAICTKNSSSNEDLWFTLLDKCYALYKKTGLLKTNTSIQDASKDYLNQFLTIISDFIKNLLGTICNYVSILKIIGNFTKNTTAEFKEMKDSLLQIITDYTHQLNILGSARDLLSDCVFKKEYEFIKLNSKGNQFQLIDCDYCKLSLNTENSNEVIAFGCGHKVHQTCTYEENEVYVCYICRQTDIEMTNMKLGMKKTNIMQSEMMSQANKSKSIISKRLKGFDKKYEERLLMVIDESH